MTGSQLLIALWGTGGIATLLGRAVWRLAPIAWDALPELAGWQWVVWTAWVVMMAHAEGYRGFHRRFSPRAAARALHLARHPRALYVAIAPLYCMNLVGASRRGVIVARCVVAGIIALVIAVRYLPQPWRGLIDAGVVVGLAIGLVSLVYYFVRGLQGAALPVDPDLPEPAHGGPQ